MADLNLRLFFNQFDFKDLTLTKKLKRIYCLEYFVNTEPLMISDAEWMCISIFQRKMFDVL